MKGCVPRLALKKRLKTTRKWHIRQGKGVVGDRGLGTHEKRGHKVHRKREKRRWGVGFPRW